MGAGGGRNTACPGGRRTARLGRVSPRWRNWLRRPHEDLRLSPWLNLAFGAALFGLFVSLWLPGLSADRTGRMWVPDVSAGRMVERHLSLYSGMETRPAWERAFHRFLFGSREEVAAEAVGVYRDVLAHYARRPQRAETWSLHNTRVRLAILLAELERWDEAEAELEVLDRSLEGAAMAAAVRVAYGRLPATGEALQAARMGAGFLPAGWSSTRLRQRLARVTGEPRTAARLVRAERMQGETQRTRVLEFSALVAVIVGAGVITGLSWWLRGRWPDPWRPAALDRPWPLADGAGVFFRAGVFGLLIFGAFMYWRPVVLGFALALWGTLFASLPMVWLIHRHLLRPRGLGLIQGFGLNPWRLGPARVLGLTAVLLAADLLGGLVINWAVWWLGFQPHWTEGINERWIWGPLSTALLSGVDAVVWAPIFEEIGFRGLLYITLRSRLAPWPAALLTSVLFSGTHLNSLAAFLAFFWSGLVWCYAIERFRTLLPAMLGHATGNALSMATMFMFYR